MSQAIRPIVILGPTAGGKSELAVRLAEHTGGQILGADSMQVYRHMDAGTAKPSAELRRRAGHHLIDIVEPTERFTVADWLDRAERLIGDLQARGIRPIVVGGTNLYLKALLEGMFEGPPGDSALRQRWADVPAEQLHQRLRRVDPAAAERISLADRKRIIRAMEVYEKTGRPISQWQTQWDNAASRSRPEAENSGSGLRFNPILIGLAWPVEQINRRINLRVKAMFYPDRVEESLAREVCPHDESLPQEVERLEKAGLLGPQASEALGYKQILEHLAGRMTLDEAFERTKILTRRFGKAQRTWLRRFRPVHWLQPADRDAKDLADETIKVLTGCHKTN